MSDKNQLISSPLHLDSSVITCSVLNTIIVPDVKSFLILLPSGNKANPVCHNILTLMAIKIHPILHGSIAPAKALQPTTCSALRNGGARNSRAQEFLLHDWP